jgi:hypothetical protein
MKTSTMSVMPTVYSLYFLATRWVVGMLWRLLPHVWYERNYLKRQDAVHEKFLQKWRDWSGVDLGKEFPEAYPTNGASEAINNLIMWYALRAWKRGVVPTLHVIQGEYEGYRKIAEGCEIEVVEHRRVLEEVLAYPFQSGDMFWISNPSAIDGEYWAEFESFASGMEATHPEVAIFLDVTYVGLVKRPVPLRPSRYRNIHATVFSLSKPFGVYYHRIGGVFSRYALPTLWANRWFKNLFSLELGFALMTRYRVTELPERYAALQAAVVNELKEKGELPEETTPCNVVILARSTTGPDAYQRAPGHYRFCLSPAMDQVINPSSRVLRLVRKLQAWAGKW